MAGAAPTPFSVLTHAPPQAAVPGPQHMLALHAAGGKQLRPVQPGPLHTPQPPQFIGSNRVSEHEGAAGVPQLVSVRMHG